MASHVSGEGSPNLHLRAGERTFIRSRKEAHLAKADFVDHRVLNAGAVIEQLPGFSWLDWMRPFGTTPAASFCSSECGAIQCPAD